MHQNKNDQQKKLAAIVLLIVLLGGAVYYFKTYQGLTLISASSISINQQGGLDGNKLIGTYWSIVMAIDYTDQVGMYIFNDAEAHTTGSSFYWQGKNLTVQNSIKLWIDPQQPYYERPMQFKSVTVVPSARQNYLSAIGQSGRDDAYIANGMTSGHWETITSDWILHTPFTIKVYVNDTLLGEKSIDEIGVVTTDTIGLGKDLTIGSGSDYFTITKLGALGTGYTIPIWPDVIWFNNQYFYINSESVRAAISSPYPLGGGAKSVGYLSADATFTNWKESFAWYWYGYTNPVNSEDYDGYWKDIGEPYPFRELGSAAAKAAPGWEEYGSDSLYKRLVPWSALTNVNIPRFPSDAKPSGALSLVEFLEQRALAKKPLMPSWEPNANNIQFVQGEGLNGYLRIYLPWGSFVPLTVTRISSELANTIIWEPQVGDFKIIDWPSDIGEIGDRKTVSITVKQESTVASSGAIKIVPVTSGLYWSFQPQTFGTGTMESGASKVFSFDVVNLGQPTRTDFKFSVQAYNSLGQLTDSKDVVGTLLPRTGGSTLLVRVIDKDTGFDVNGIHVIVNYDTLSKEGWTSGGVVSFDFQGGTPMVTISTGETAVYQSATVMKQIVAGPNSVTIELLKQGEKEEEIPWMLIITITALIVVIVVVIFVASRKKAVVLTKKRKPVSR